jgi:chromosome segregation protein
MHLKRLELHGYKSFASRTEFVFNDGVTAIVGPNGSGKSNIADAIQWVLGEQSFSNLRAKKTEDMIFAGSASRVRMGMAEVSMTLDNSAQWLPIEFSEVTITRRAYRSGENDYLLNGTKMRLRDINELLSKGGLGRGSYTVIGQGLIDSAISLRPEERRTLLEDAAGITIYQSKKADALGKLKATHENLTRVADIVHELGPRVKRLHDQANRAGQFEEVQRNLAEHLQTWYGYQWQQAQERLSESEKAVKRVQAELLDARQSLQGSDAERAQLRERIQAQRAELDVWRRELAEQQRAQQALEQRRAVADERHGLLTQQHAELLAELEALDAEEQSAAATQTELSAQMVQLQSDLQASNTTLIQTRQATAKREESVRRVRAAQAETQRNALALTQQAADYTQRSQSAQQRLHGIAEELAQSEQAQATLSVEGNALESQRAAAQHQFDSLVMQLSEIAAELQVTQDRAATLQQEATRRNSESAEAQAQARAAQIELDSARGRGIADLLEAARANNVSVIGALASLYRVAPEHDPLVRGALGPYAGAVVVPRWDDAHRLADGVRTQRIILVAESFVAGPSSQDSSFPSPLDLSGSAPERGREMPLLRHDTGAWSATPKDFGRDSAAGALAAGGHMPPGASNEPENKPDTDESLGSAYALLTCASEHRPMFHALLSQVRADGDGQLRVTARGDLISAHSIVTPDLSAPNFSALEHDLLAKQTKAANLSARLEQARSDEIETVKRRDSLGAARYELDGERSRAKSELEAVAREQARRREENDRLRSTAVRLAAELERLTQQVDDWGQALNSLQAKQSEMEPLALTGTEVSTDDLALPRQLAEQETRTALLRQELLSRQQSLAQLSARLKTFEAQRQGRAQRAANLKTETLNLQDETTRLATQVAALSTTIDPLVARIEPAAELLQAEEAALRERELQELAGRERLYAAEAAHGQALVDLQRRQDRQVTLREQIESDYEFVSLTTDLPVALALELDENRVLRLPHVSVVPDTLEHEIRSLKNKMRWIGNVNLEAPSEYALEKARLEFLNTQSTDLQRASESLHQLVQELDQVMQHKFRETFDAVARAFKEYFTKLFGGGSAELVLTEPANLGETGIEILAHPPGKRRQPLGLLSGGERALTAGALVFALLRSSPTPFCVLDEVDAALDEANVGRFRTTLREIAERTQFIVVTHNRGTVEVAGTVYGISMGGDGASQMISLRLDGVDVPETRAA